MARSTVPLVTGETYHVFNRGVDKRDIFLRKEDYLRFYRTLKLFNTIQPCTNYLIAQIHEEDSGHEPLVEIHAYSLLPNHFHLLLRQVQDGGLSEFLKRVLGGYTSYFNEQHERSGALFQGRYKRVLVESGEQYQYLFAYVNENHLVHGIQRPNEIMYSSSLHYQKRSVSKLISEEVPYNEVTNQALARDIYAKRMLSKSTIFD